MQRLRAVFAGFLMAVVVFAGLMVWQGRFGPMSFIGVLIVCGALVIAIIPDLIKRMRVAVTGSGAEFDIEAMERIEAGVTARLAGKFGAMLAQE